MKHVPFCIFQQLGTVIVTLTNLWSCVRAFIMQTLSSGSSSICCYQECSGFNHVCGLNGIEEKTWKFCIFLKNRLLKSK